jgi:hypothetical protein
VVTAHLSAVRHIMCVYIAHVWTQCMLSDQSSYLVRGGPGTAALRSSAVPPWPCGGKIIYSSRMRVAQ